MNTGGSISAQREKWQMLREIDRFISHCQTTSNLHPTECSEAGERLHVSRQKEIESLEVADCLLRHGLNSTREAVQLVLLRVRKWRLVTTNQFHILQALRQVEYNISKLQSWFQESGETMSWRRFAQHLHVIHPRLEEAHKWVNVCEVELSKLDSTISTPPTSLLQRHRALRENLLDVEVQCRARVAQMSPREQYLLLQEEAQRQLEMLKKTRDKVTDTYLEAWCFGPGSNDVQRSWRRRAVEEVHGIQRNACDSVEEFINKVEMFECFFQEDETRVEEPSSVSLERVNHWRTHAKHLNTLLSLATVEIRWRLTEMNQICDSLNELRNHGEELVKTLRNSSDRSSQTSVEELLPEEEPLWEQFRARENACAAFLTRLKTSLFQGNGEDDQHPDETMENISLVQLVLSMKLCRTWLILLNISEQLRQSDANPLHRTRRYSFHPKPLATLLGFIVIDVENLPDLLRQHVKLFLTILDALESHLSSTSTMHWKQKVRKFENKHQQIQFLWGVLCEEFESAKQLVNLREELDNTTYAPAQQQSVRRKFRKHSQHASPLASALLQLQRSTQFRYQEAMEWYGNVGFPLLQIAKFHVQVVKDVKHVRRQLDEWEKQLEDTMEAFLETQDVSTDLQSLLIAWTHDLQIEREAVEMMKSNIERGKLDDKLFLSVDQVSFDLQCYAERLDTFVGVVDQFRKINEVHQKIADIITQSQVESTLTSVEAPLAFLTTDILQELSQKLHQIKEDPELYGLCHQLWGSRDEIQMTLETWDHAKSSFDFILHLRDLLTTVTQSGPISEEVEEIEDAPEPSLEPLIIIKEDEEPSEGLSSSQPMYPSPVLPERAQKVTISLGHKLCLVCPRDFLDYSGSDLKRNENTWILKHNGHPLQLCDWMENGPDDAWDAHWVKGKLHLVKRAPVQKEDAGLYTVQLFPRRGTRESPFLQYQFLVTIRQTASGLLREKLATLSHVERSLHSLAISVKKSYKSQRERLSLSRSTFKMQQVFVNTMLEKTASVGRRHSSDLMSDTDQRHAAGLKYVKRVQDEELTDNLLSPNSVGDNMGLIREGLPPVTEVRLGDRVQLLCRYFEDSDVDVNWFHNGQPIKTASGVRILVYSDRSTLTLDIARLQHEGNYTAQVVGSTGKSDATETHLKVIKPRGNLPTPQPRRFPVDSAPSASPPVYSHRVVAEVNDSSSSSGAVDGAKGATDDRVSHAATYSQPAFTRRRFVSSESFPTVQQPQQSSQHDMSYQQPSTTHIPRLRNQQQISVKVTVRCKKNGRPGHESIITTFNDK